MSSVRLVTTDGYVCKIKRVIDVIEDGALLKITSSNPATVHMHPINKVNHLVWIQVELTQ